MPACLGFITRKGAFFVINPNLLQFLVIEELYSYGLPTASVTPTSSINAVMPSHVWSST